MKTRLFNIDTVLLTERIVVRRFRENDGKAFFTLVQDNQSRIEDHLPKTVKAVTSANKGEKFVREKLAAWLLQEEYTFGLWEKDTAKLIGMIRFSKLNWEIPLAEISYFIDKDFSKKGIMTEAMFAAIEFAFKELKLAKIILRTAMDNYPSQRLARKCGFRREGDIRSEFKKPSGDIIDIMLFGLTNTEYQKV